MRVKSEHASAQPNDPHEGPRKGEFFENYETAYLTKRDNWDAVRVAASYDFGFVSVAAMVL